MLRKDILDGKTEGKTSRQVYEMHVEYRKYEFKRFSPNYRNLVEALKKEGDRAGTDAAAYYNDLLHYKQLVPARTKPHWNTSSAKELLEDDIDAGNTDDVEPTELHASRAEYQEFELSVFRKHIHQAKKSRANREYYERFLRGFTAIEEPEDEEEEAEEE